MMFKIMNNMAPQYLAGIFQPLRDLHELTLRDTYLNLRLPSMSTDMGQRSFSYQCALTSGTRSIKRIKWELHSSHLDGFYSSNKMQLILLRPFYFYSFSLLFFTFSVY